VLGTTTPTCVVTTSAINERLTARGDTLPELRTVPRLCVDETPDQDCVHWSAPEIAGSDLAFLQFTSGSVSDPKGVMISHANILHNLEMLQDSFRHTDESRIVCWLPFFHDWGLIGGLLQPIYSGIESILYDPFEFVRNPRSWLETISRFGVTVSGAPNFAYDQCLHTMGTEDCVDLDLSSWEVAIVGAEPIRAETLDRFSEKFATCGFRRSSFITSYGLAETTLIVTGSDRVTAPSILAIDRAAFEGGRVEAASSPDDTAAVRLVGCGQVLLDQQVRIVTENGTPCGDMEIGEIWVAGPSVAQGYWQSDLSGGYEPEKQGAATLNQFSTTLPDVPNTRFLPTGDQGFIHEGELYVTGRIKDLIIVSGRNLYPEDIERVAREADPILQRGKGAAFSVNVAGVEQYVVAHEAHFDRVEDGDAAIEAIRSAVTSATGVAPWAITLVKAGGIPRTSSGKVRRQAARQMFLAKELVCQRIWYSQPSRSSLCSAS
jgi:acyl-CoA synthetase (AMP-forming)/AMP-acid ligase II